MVFSQTRPGVTTNCHGLNTVKHVCHAGFNTQGDALSNRVFFFFLICMLFIFYERSKNILFFKLSKIESQIESTAFQLHFFDFNVSLLNVFLGFPSLNFNLTSIKVTINDNI